MRTIADLREDQLDKLEWIMFHACPSYDPWADMMYLSGAGDPGIDQFPLDLDDIETIDITMVGGEESEALSGEAGGDAGSQSASPEEAKKSTRIGLGLGLGVDVNLS